VQPGIDLTLSGQPIPMHAPPIPIHETIMLAEPG
jgi:hypothetical protein